MFDLTNREKIFLVITIIALAWYILGPPKEFNFFGLTWENKKSEPIGNQPANIPVEVRTIIVEPIKSVYAKDALDIENLKSRQQIYALDDVATVDFKIANDMNIPYNFTVNWFNNRSAYSYWYNESNITWPVQAYSQVKQKGEWKVQVVLRWSYVNNSYSKDATTSFEVS